MRRPVLTLTGPLLAITGGFCVGALALAYVFVARPDATASPGFTTLRETAPMALWGWLLVLVVAVVVVGICWSVDVLIAGLFCAVALHLFMAGCLVVAYQTTHVGIVGAILLVKVAWAWACILAAARRVLA